jgi:hypothetical protein
MEIFKKIKSRITMKEIKTLFWDKHNGMAVNLYVDCYGVEWMAQKKGLLSFRCKRNNNQY